MCVTHPVNYMETIALAGLYLAGVMVCGLAICVHRVCARKIRREREETEALLAQSGRSGDYAGFTPAV